MGLKDSEVGLTSISGISSLMENLWLIDGKMVVDWLEKIKEHHSYGWFLV